EGQAVQVAAEGDPAHRRLALAAGLAHGDEQVRRGARELIAPGRAGELAARALVHRDRAVVLDPEPTAHASPRCARAGTGGGAGRSSRRPFLAQPADLHVLRCSMTLARAGAHLSKAVRERSAFSYIVMPSAVRAAARVRARAQASPCFRPRGAVKALAPFFPCPTKRESASSKAAFFFGSGWLTTPRWSLPSSPTARPTRIDSPSGVVSCWNA